MTPCAAYAVEGANQRRPQVRVTLATSYAGDASGLAAVTRRFPRPVDDHRFANLQTSMITDTRTAQQPPDNVDTVFHLAMR